MMRSKWRAREAALVAAAALVLACGEHQDPGTIEGARLPDAVLQSRANAEAQTARTLAESATSPVPDEQILFGDLHVHTTFSADAFMMSLPILQGEGAHPIADACDYARYCSGLDFWSINDHAESITPARWQETQDAIRQCNAVAGDPQNPDMVSFLGWEWTQIGHTPENHYGHKNVMLRDTEADEVPRRPIALGLVRVPGDAPEHRLSQRVLLPLADFPNRQYYLEHDRASSPSCATRRSAKKASTRASCPTSCSEGADTPEKLFAKLDQWGYPALVIPHGTTWGIYTPPGSAWDKQLTAKQHDPERQTLDRGVLRARQLGGVPRLPRGRRSTRPATPSAPSRRATTCRAAGGRRDHPRALRGSRARRCASERVEAARANYVAAGARGRLTVPGATVDDWRELRQLSRLLPARLQLPPEEQRPVHHGALANSRPQPRRGPACASTSASSRRATTTARGRAPATRNTTASPTPKRAAPRDADLVRPRERGHPARDDAPSRRPSTSRRTKLQNFQVLDFERQASFFLTGGLVAVHADGRDPRSDLGLAPAPRGLRHQRRPHPALVRPAERAAGHASRWAAATQLAEAPRFRVRAVGAFEQQAGLPRRLARADSRPSGSNASAAASVTTRPTSAAASRASRSCASGRSVSPDEPVGALIEDPVADASVPGRSDRLQRRVRGSRVPRRAPRGALLRARDPGADAGGERRPRALHARRERALHRSRTPATATTARPLRTTASRRAKSAPGRRRSS